MASGLRWPRPTGGTTHPTGVNSHDRRRTTLPRLRHHAARRRAARGHQPPGRRQADHRPAPGRLRRRLHRGRLARRQPPGHRVLRPRRGSEIDLKHAALVAFGATRKAGREGRRRPAGRGAAGRPAPRCHPGRQVPRPPCRARAAHHARREPGDGPRHRRATCAREGRRVFVDCEHFFDGYRANPEYALAVVRAAHEAGADVVVLCDTNGGMLPAQVRRSWPTVLADTGARLGIHAQDDTGCAVANTLAAVDAGATHVQCTANGYGERVGNANLFPVVAALELKYGKPGAARGRARRDDPDLARHRRGRQPHALHPPAVRRGLRLRAQGGPARLGDQGRPGPLPAHRPRAGRQHHADAGLRHGRPRLDRAQGQGARLSTSPATASWSAGWSSGSRSARLQGYTYEAADASFELLLRDEVEGRAPRYFRSSPGGRSSSSAPTARRSTRPPSSCGPRASGSSPPARATARSTRSTGRCARRWSGSTRSSPSWSWSTTRSASWRAGTAPAPPPACWSTTSDGAARVVHGRRRRERHRRVLAGAGGRLHLRAAAGGRRTAGVGSGGSSRGELARRRPSAGPTVDRHSSYGSPTFARTYRRPSSFVERRRAHVGRGEPPGSS